MEERDLVVVEVIVEVEVVVAAAVEDTVVHLLVEDTLNLDLNLEIDHPLDLLNASRLHPPLNLPDLNRRNVTVQNQILPHLNADPLPPLLPSE